MIKHQQRGYKTFFCPQFANVRDKLECLSLAQEFHNLLNWVLKIVFVKILLIFENKDNTSEKCFVNTNFLRRSTDRPDYFQ
jgi:hypothetical protein